MKAVMMVVPLMDGGQAEVSLEVTDGTWAIHRAPGPCDRDTHPHFCGGTRAGDGYTVLHVPTGRALIQCLERGRALKCRRAAAQAFPAAMDLDLSNLHVRGTFEDICWRALPRWMIR